MREGRRVGEREGESETRANAHAHTHTHKRTHAGQHARRRLAVSNVSQVAGRPCRHLRGVKRSGRGEQVCIDVCACVRMCVSVSMWPCRQLHCAQGSGRGGVPVCMCACVCVYVYMSVWPRLRLPCVHCPMAEEGRWCICVCVSETCTHMSCSYYRMCWFAIESVLLVQNVSVCLCV